MMSLRYYYSAPPHTFANGQTRRCDYDLISAKRICLRIRDTFSTVSGTLGRRTFCSFRTCQCGLCWSRGYLARPRIYQQIIRQYPNYSNMGWVYYQQVGYILTPKQYGDCRRVLPYPHSLVQACSIFNSLLLWTAWVYCLFMRIET